MKSFPIIDLAATGSNIRQLRLARGLSVRDLQRYFGFEEPQAIYKWQRGESLPTVDNLYALGALLEVPMEQILVEASVSKMQKEQQVKTCCSPHFMGKMFCASRGGYAILSENVGHFIRRPDRKVPDRSTSIIVRGRLPEIRVCFSLKAIIPDKWRCVDTGMVCASRG